MFRAAIIESGSPMNTWAYQDDPNSYAIHLASAINSTITELTTKELVEFLQRVDSRALDVASTVALGVNIFSSWCGHCFHVFQFSVSTIIPKRFRSQHHT